MPSDDAIEALAQVAARHPEVMELLTDAATACEQSNYAGDYATFRRLQIVIERADAIAAEGENTKASSNG